jgi:glutathione S-transferase
VLLYNSQVSGNCYKLRLLLAHLGLEYERHEVDVVDRSNRLDLLGTSTRAARADTGARLGWS